MKVKAISPRGYCYGVINAIKIAKETKDKYPKHNIYILGMIVHNTYIKKALDKLNIITLDDTNTSRLSLLDEIDNGVVILSAHGTSQEVKDKAIAKGLIVVDATCQDVTKTHNLINDYLSNGYEILYYGKKNHPEAIAALSINHNKIHLVTSKDDLDNLKELLINKKILITNQTTLSIIDTKDLYDYAKQIFNDITIASEICNATRIRQEAILALEDDIDFVYVVGDPKSNNSNKLAILAQNKKRIVKMIESINDINIEDLKDIKKIAITSGASTPTYLTNMVIDYLKQLDFKNSNTHQKTLIDISKII